MTNRTRTDIEAEVEELAEQVLEHAPDLSIEAARSVVYEELPELYDEYVAAPAAPPTPAFSKSYREPTLGDEICVAVRKRAAHLAWTEWPTKTIEDLEWEVWNTPEGQALYSLYTSPDGKQPMSQAEMTIGKSFSHADVWTVFQQWRAG